MDTISRNFIAFSAFSLLVALPFSSKTKTLETVASVTVVNNAPNLSFAQGERVEVIDKDIVTITPVVTKLSGISPNTSLYVSVDASRSVFWASEQRLPKNERSNLGHIEPSINNLGISRAFTTNNMGSFEMKIYTSGAINEVPDQANTDFLMAEYELTFHF